MIQAVLDRWEEDRAVLLVEPEEYTVVFHRKDLPAGLQEGDWLTLDFRYDERATRKSREEANTLLQELQQSGKEK